MFRRLAFATCIAALAPMPAPAQGRLESQAKATPPRDVGKPSITRKRIAEAGCPLCHRDTAPAGDPGRPLAPSFAEIAARYRGDPGAHARLARIVVDGADPADRHWKERHDFTAMGANAPRVTPEAAREYVRWILDRR
jgi:cytochrome c551/c552